MAVQRAWIKQEGTVVKQLSNELMDEFLKNVLDGLYRLAVTHVNEGKTESKGKSPKSSAVTAVEDFVSNV